MVLLHPRIKRNSKQHRSWQMRLRVVRVSVGQGLCPHVKNHALDAWLVFSGRPQILRRCVAVQTGQQQIHTYVGEDHAYKTYYCKYRGFSA